MKNILSCEKQLVDQLLTINLITNYFDQQLIMIL